MGKKVVNIKKLCLNRLYCNVLKTFFSMMILCFTVQGAGIAGGKSFMGKGIFRVKDTVETSINIEDQSGFYLEFYLDNEDDSPADVAWGLKYNTFVQEGTGQSIAHVTTLYGVGRYVWDIPVVKPYFQIKVGYPYAIDGDYISEYSNSGLTEYNDLVGDVYFGAGVGMELVFADVSINYDLNSFKLKSTGWDGEKDVVEGHVSLNVGFKF